MRVLDVLDDALGADEGGAAIPALQLHVEALRVLLEGGALQERARAVLALVGAAHGRLWVHGDRRHEGRPPGRGAQDVVLLLPTRVESGLLLPRARCRVVVEPVPEVGHSWCRTVVEL